MTVLSKAQTFGDVCRENANVRGAKLALQTLNGRSLTFSALNDRINRLNDAVATLGLEPSDRVAILSKNRIEYVEAYGLSKSGFVVVPLNWRLVPSELVRLLEHSSPRILLVDGDHRDRVDALRYQLPFVEHFVLLDGTGDAWTSYEPMLASANAAEPAIAARPGDTLCLIYTSGTTGAPKGVEMTHAGAIGNARTAATEMLGLTDSDEAMAVMPLFHAGGMWYHLFPCLAMGCTTLLLQGFESATVLRELAQRRITNVHLVPTMIAELVAHPLVPFVDLSSLRLIFYAASSMPPDLLQRALSTFAPCAFSQSFGSTEAGVVTVLGPLDHLRAATSDGEHLLSSCGRPFTSHDVRLVGDSGELAELGSVGEVEVRSSDIMKGYWKDDIASRAVMRDGWLRTGDLGRIDSEGYLYIVDRKNDMIVTGGENVFPSEVESWLNRDVDVAEAAVFGVPDEKWVEKVVVAVVLKADAAVSSEILISRLRENLSAYKCPKAIFITSSLPKNAIGKVLRKELRSRYGQFLSKRS